MIFFRKIVNLYKEQNSRARENLNFALYILQKDDSLTKGESRDDDILPEESSSIDELLFFFNTINKDLKKQVSIASIKIFFIE
jgi:hypothetical protein